MEQYRTEFITEQPASEPQHGGFVRFVVDLLETLVIAVLLFIGINAVSARIRVDGFSMYPTLQNGEYVIVDKLTYRIGSPQRGDVVVFHNPRNPAQEYIKRVIGLPGDIITILDGTVFVNGDILQEPYVNAPPLYENEWVVPNDAYFVLGDNRNNSSDSHTWGAVPTEYMVGKAVLVYWPLTELGLVDRISSANAAQ